MKHRALQDLIGRAIVDREFRDRLLNGNREQVVAEFDLTDIERRAIHSIEAQSFEEFAGSLQDWIESVDDTPKHQSGWLSEMLRQNRIRDTASD
jgi:hypothetical protein